MYESDFNEAQSEQKALSMEDQRFLEIMESSVARKGNHYVLPLPFRNQEVVLPDNKEQAMKRVYAVK